MGEADGGGVAHCLPHCNDAGGGRQLLRRKMLRLDLDGDAERLPPARQLLQPVGLALRAALRQRQAAGACEDGAEIDRPDAEARAVLRRQRLDPRRTEMRPGRVQRGIVVDVQAHGGDPPGGSLHALAKCGNIPSVVLSRPCPGCGPGAGWRCGPLPSGRCALVQFPDDAVRFAVPANMSAPLTDEQAWPLSPPRAWRSRNSVAR
jgi:hypothetical protein